MSDSSTNECRVIVLGASNVARSITTVFQYARQFGDSGVDFYAAMGHGRSYGQSSRALGRRLPGILQSDLWQRLKASPSHPTYSLITDVGNDLVYGASSSQLLTWVDECCDHLEANSTKIAITGLPLTGLKKLSPIAFAIMRTILFPKSKLQRPELFESAMEVDAGLRQIAQSRGAAFIEPDPDWYGLDPIHIKFSQMRSAWGKIFSQFGPTTESNKVAYSPLLGLRLRTLVPNQRFLFGFEQNRSQPAWTAKNQDRVFYF
ncbi:MAG: hypothetical protein ACI97A_003111 [Planctomycetota bacterium]|jgi:hypothetical protein